MSEEVDQAAAKVVARLGRRPVDSLEAAVALEAWCGIEAPRSLALGPAIVDLTRGRSQLWRKPLVSRGEDRVLDETPNLKHLIGGVAVLLAIMIWMAALPEFEGGSMGSHALIAMPSGLGVQWFLQSRYLAGEGGLGRLRALDIPSALLIIAAVSIPWALAGDSGELVAALAVVWAATPVLVIRGWGLSTSVVFIAAAIAAAFGTSARLNAAIVVDSVMVAAIFAVVTAPRTSRPAGGWAPAGMATTVGILMGLIVVVGMSEEALDVVTPASPVVVLVILGAMWGSLHLNRLWAVTLSSPIDQRSEVPGHSLQARMGEVIQGAIVRVLGVGVAALPIGVALANNDERLKALLPLTAFVLAMMVVVLGSLVAGFRRGPWAAAALGAGCCVAAAVRIGGVEGLAPGIALALGSITSIAVLVTPVKQMIDDPGMSIATLL